MRGVSVPSKLAFDIPTQLLYSSFSYDVLERTFRFLNQAHRQEALDLLEPVLLHL